MLILITNRKSYNYDLLIGTKIGRAVVAELLVRLVIEVRTLEARWVLVFKPLSME